MSYLDYYGKLDHTKFLMNFHLESKYQKSVIFALLANYYLTTVTIEIAVRLVETTNYQQVYGITNSFFPF